MIYVEVKSTDGRVIDRREFSLYDVALAWFETAHSIYGRGVNIFFGPSNAILR